MNEIALWFIDDTKFGKKKKHEITESIVSISSVKQFISQAQDDFKKKWDSPSHVSEILIYSFSFTEAFVLAGENFARGLGQSDKSFL